MSYTGKGIAMLICLGLSFAAATQAQTADALPDYVPLVPQVSSGATPFTVFDLTTNMHDYLKFFDELKSMDFDVMVPGHHGTPATHEDVQVAKS